MSFRSLVKKLIPRSLFKRVEPFGHLLEAVLLNLAKGFPARGLKIIGVTGTDGKTSTSTLIAQMLRQSGLKVGLLTTISVDYGDGQGDRPSPTSQTTASVRLLLGMLKKMKNNDVDWVVMETSSHALAQNRVWGMPYSVAVLTNVTHEHLDYHGTFERYRDAKRKLFQITSRNNNGLRAGVINADDPSAELFIGDIANPLTYGIKNGDLRATKLKLAPAGSRYAVKTEDEEYRIECHLPGEFNVYNSLAALGVGRALGLTKQQIEDGIASLKSVPGRMERVEAGQPFDVIVDYAVTPEALESVLKTVKTITEGDVHIIFGATGDRDRAKRPVMGKVVAGLTDHIYLTDDETYTENPETIRQEVYSGIDEAGGAEKTAVIADRREAIKTAFEMAKPGDCVLLTGLGHQKYRNMGGEKQPWDEREVARELIQSS
jgi:UDP-N-acetylmuramoyl-L-alanyl-D-glutamate--2,6-diaminopimelate ligase